MNINKLLQESTRQMRI